MGNSELFTHPTSAGLFELFLTSPSGKRGHTVGMLMVRVIYDSTSRASVRPTNHSRTGSGRSGSIHWDVAFRRDAGLLTEDALLEVDREELLERADEKRKEIDRS